MCQQLSKRELLSVVSEQGEHISTYRVTKDKLVCIAEDGFWIWKDRPI